MILKHTTKSTSTSFKNTTTKHQMSVGGAITGHQADSVEFDKKDFDDLLSMNPDQLREYLFQISCRFDPS